MNNSASRISGCSDDSDYRIQTLWVTVQNALSTILNDQVIHTMKDNPISSQFVWERIAEVFTETVTHEREQLIAELTTTPRRHQQMVVRYELEKRKNGELTQQLIELTKAYQII